MLVQRRTGFARIAALLAGLVTLSPALLQANGSASTSVMLAPDTAAASRVQWTVRMLTPYCGGYKVGGYVTIRFLPPFILPPSVPSAAVSFADGPATVTRKDDILQIAPAPGRIWSMLCGAELPLEIVLSKGAGLRNPARRGTYAVEVSTEANPKPIRVPVVVGPARP
ncbi:MAG TPA: hypothetical protein VGZ23_09945 [bacterium]|nr:hypothetical protein [bacterium]